MIILMALALAGVLFFGLRPKDYDFSNRVSLIEGNRGLQFEKYSIAYSQPLGTEMAGQLAGPEGFTLFLNFKPRPEFNDGFGLIAVMHAGKDADQLIVGQWKNHIIAMNGDDYAHKRKLPRIAFDTLKIIDASKPSSNIQLVLTSAIDGTRLYVNGRLVKEKSNITLKMPTWERTRLILGNSPYSKASWQGDIYGLALFPGTMSIHEFDFSSTNGAVVGDAQATAPFLQYDFKTIEQGRVKDLSGNGVHLDLPKSITPLKKKMLAWPWPGLEMGSRLFRDVALNILGFVPLGFFFSVVLMQSGSLAGKQVVLVTVLFCFLLSLGIEVAQAWLPSRDSSLLDLGMNTTGAMIGALFSLARCTRAR